MVDNEIENSYRVSRNEISSLIKEQRQLKSTEIKLKSMIEKINNQLNQLLVEELQLKSRELDQKYPVNSAKNMASNSESPATSDINKQALNLNVHHITLLKSLEESEEDDELSVIT
ncbi:uncharacterized protein LOC128742746 [Sabethes cyaneus]|uniref:uncharacterized protein LOC128742746 n=1 Tax=Sabethes cyaneus TaxID=53552 RepID=UPI00237E560E|nr:uncharacterized protein LOC128742746 [Sabethes cyaneus]